MRFYFVEVQSLVLVMFLKEILVLLRLMTEMFDSLMTRLQNLRESLCATTLHEHSFLKTPSYIVALTTASDRVSLLV